MAAILAAIPATAALRLETPTVPTSIGSVSLRKRKARMQTSISGSTSSLVLQPPSRPSSDLGWNSVLLRALTGKLKLQADHL